MDHQKIIPIHYSLVIKTSPKLVPVTHIRTNMTTAGMSRERYFELLKRLT